MEKNKVTFETAKKAFTKKGYKIYAGAYNLNIFGVRCGTPQELAEGGEQDQSKDEFNDFICVAYCDENGKNLCKVYPATTDPGAKELLNPSFTAAKIGGTAIMCPGQYPSAYKKGIHGSGNWAHKALLQVGTISIYRDKDRDSKLDFKNPEKSAGTGINIHASSLWGSLEKIGLYSAGCQVFKNGPDHDEFMELVDKQNQYGFGSKCTYTLFLETDFS